MKLLENHEIYIIAWIIQTGAGCITRQLKLTTDSAKVSRPIKIAYFRVNYYLTTK